MIKSILPIQFIALTVFFLSLSCVSQPPPVPDQITEPTRQPTPAAGSNQALLDELNAAIARAEQAHARAVDFESPAYFPGEWEAAEELFSQAGLVPRSGDADIRRAIDAYNTAADSFDSVFMLTIPLYAQAREDEIMALRTPLVAVGARDTFPGYFSPADSTAILAYEQYEEEDYYPARDSAGKALLMYRTLDTGFGAWRNMSEINERDFRLYDLDQYEKADEMLDVAVNGYESGNLPDALENAEEARLRFSLVLSTAWAGYAELRSMLAEGEYQAALDMKTNIAARDYFMMADSDRVAAQALLESERYEEAAKLFINAEAMYVIASMTALEKRRHASETLREANRKIEESEMTARRAESIISESISESIIEGGSR